MIGHLFISVSADASGVAKGLSRAEAAVERFGSRMFFMGSRMTAGITLPILGMTRAVTQFGMALDEAMSNSVAIMDDSAQKMKGQMTDLAIELSKNSKFTAVEIAKGYYDLASAGLEAEEAMNAIGTVTTFAQAGLMDMGTAGEFLAGAVAALGPKLVLLESQIDGVRDKEEAMARVADMLTMANNKALGTVEDFANALTNKAAAAMRMYGIRAEEGVAALMVYASQNIRGKAAGQQLWMVLRDLQMATLRATDQWKRYNISVYDATGRMRPLYNILGQMQDRLEGMSDLERSTMFKSLGLQDRSRAALQVLIGHAKDMQGYVQDMHRSQGEAARVAARQMEAVAYQWEAVKNRFKAGLWEVWKAFVPILLDSVLPAIEKLGDGLVEWGKWLAGTSEFTRKLILGMAALVAAAGPVIAVLGSMTIFTSALIAPFSKLISWFYVGSEAFKRAQLAMVVSGSGRHAWGPIVLMEAIKSSASHMASWGAKVLPVVVKLAGLFTMLKPAIFETLSSFDAFRDRLIGVVMLASPIAAMLAGIGAWFLGAARSVLSSVTGWQTFGEVFRTLGQTVADVLVVIQYGWVMLMRLMQSIGQQVREDLAAVVRLVPQYMQATSTAVVAWTRHTMSALQEFGAQVGVWGERFLSRAGEIAQWWYDNFLGEGVAAFRTSGQLVWGAFMDYVWTPFLGQLVAAFAATGKLLATEAWAMFSTIGRGIAGALQSWMTTLISALGIDRALAAVADGVSHMVQSFSQLPGVSHAIAGVHTTLDGFRVLLDTLTSAFSNFGAMMNADSWRGMFLRWLSTTMLGQAVGLLDRWKKLVQEARDEIYKQAKTTDPKQDRELIHFGLTESMYPAIRFAPSFMDQTGLRRTPLVVGGTYRNPYGLNLDNIQPLGEDEAGWPSLPPTKPDTEATRFAALVKQQRDMLLGEGDRTWQALETAFRQNKAAVLGNDEALRRLTDAYVKVRGELHDLPADIEAATAALRAQDDAVTAMGTPQRKLLATLIGEVAPGDIEKMIPELERELDQLLRGPSILGVGGETRAFNVSATFLEAHRTELAYLSTQYDRLPPRIQEVVAQYRAWAAVTDTVTDRNRDLASTASNDLTRALSVLPAKIADAELELHMVRVASEDRTLKNLTKGWNEQTLAYLQELVKRQNALKHFSDADRQVEQARLDEWSKGMQRLLDIGKRTDMERMANTLGANKAIMYSFRALSVDTVWWYLKMKTSWHGVRVILDEVSTGFATLAKVFDKSGTGLLTWLSTLTSLANRARDVGIELGVAFRGMDNALHKVTELQDGTKSVTQDWGAFAASAAAAFVAIANGIQAMDEATSSMSRMRNTIGGATVGFQMGQAIVPGWGGAIGALVGALVGIFRKNPTQEAMKTVGRVWGFNISEGLAQVITEQSSRFQTVLSKGSVEASAVFNWDKIVEEMGGVSSGNVIMLLTQLNRTFDFMRSRAFSAAEGIDVLTRAIPALATYAKKAGFDLATVMQTTIRGLGALAREGQIRMEDMRGFFETNFQAFVDGIVDMNRVASRAFLELLSLHRDLGVEAPSVLAFITQQAERAGTAWTDLLKAITAPVDALKTALDEAKTKIQDLLDQGEDAEPGALSAAELRLKQLSGDRGTLAANLAPELERMGSLILATFNAGTRQGMSWADALSSVGGALDTLIAAWDTLGLSSENAAVKELARYRQMMTSNQALFSGVSALHQGVVALSYMGGLTQDTFNTLQTQGLAMYTRMQSAAEQAGGTTVDALRPMVPWLTAMRDAAEEYGLELDANTQMLIDQAMELGLLKPKAETTAEIMEAGFADLKEVLGGVRDVLAELRLLLQGLTTQPHTITVGYNIPTPPTVPGVPAPPEPPTAVPGPGPDVQSYSADAARSAEASGDMHVTLVMPDGDVLVKQVVKSGRRLGLIPRG